MNRAILFEVPTHGITDTLSILWYYKYNVNLVVRYATTFTTGLRALTLRILSVALGILHELMQREHHTAFTNSSKGPNCSIVLIASSLSFSKYAMSILRSLVSLAISASIQRCPFVPVTA